MFDVADDAECAFVGEVIRIYRQPSEQPLGVLQVGEFRFYVQGESITNFAVGDQVAGAGTLLFDYYIWVEFLNEYAEPPNLFYTLQVKRIRKVRGDQYSADDIQDLQLMESQNFDGRFYLIDLDSEGVAETNIPKTFLGA